MATSAGKKFLCWYTEMSIYRYDGEVEIKKKYFHSGILKYIDIEKCRYIECRYKWIALYIVIYFLQLEGTYSTKQVVLLDQWLFPQVGTYLKTPKYPVWVVCSESHFSVLFSTRRDLVNDWKAERRFDLYYYDGLSRQQEEIKLTISRSQSHYRVIFLIYLHDCLCSILNNAYWSFRGFPWIF